MTLNFMSPSVIVGQTAEAILSRHPDIVADIQRCFEQQRSVKREVSSSLDPVGEGKRMINTVVPCCGDHIVEFFENRAAVWSGFTRGRKSDTRFHEFAEHFPAIIYEIDPNGMLVFANQRAADAFRYRPDTAGRRHLVDFLAPGDRQRASRNFKRLLQGKAVAPQEYRALCGDGTTFDGLFHSGVFDRHGRVAGIRGLAIDITERLDAHRQLVNAHADLERKNYQCAQELAKASAALKSNRAELTETKAALARLKGEILETNRAMTVLAHNLNRNKKQNDSKIALTISMKVLPIVEKLCNAENLREHRTELDTLALYLTELTHPLLETNACFISLLSPTEMKIAAMIKNGMSSPRIAQKLFVTEDTVKTHRRNIRRKLGLKNARINLKSYLIHKWDGKIHEH